VLDATEVPAGLAAHARDGRVLHEGLQLALDFLGTTWGHRPMRSPRQRSTGGRGLAAHLLALVVAAREQRLLQLGDIVHVAVVKLLHDELLHAVVLRAAGSGGGRHARRRRRRGRPRRHLRELGVPRASRRTPTVESCMRSSWMLLGSSSLARCDALVGERTPRR